MYRRENPDSWPVERRLAAGYLRGTMKVVQRWDDGVVDDLRLILHAIAAR